LLPRRLFAERSRRLRDGPHWGGAFAFPGMMGIIKPVLE
jgi:hypothetical protein